MQIVKRYSSLLFLVLLALAAMYYNYQAIVFRQPQSVHAWRQSDCASLALNYYQNGMKFFAPETHNLTSDGGTSGKCCTSEIPILYYCVAVLYQLFGYHDSIFRLFNTLIFFLGLFYLFRLFKFLLKDIFWAIALTLLFFTSPVLVYYGNNFLSNSSALSFSFIGWNYFVRFIHEKNKKWFYAAIAVFFLAGAFKVTALMSLCAITALIVVEMLRMTHFDGEKPLFRKSANYLIPIIPVFLIIGGWIVYAHFFNLKHQCTYFSTTIFPIWDLNSEAIKGVLRNVRVIWAEHYFHTPVLIFLGGCFLFILLNFRKGNKVLMYSVLLIFIEVILYILLQFWTFRDHDYYVIDIYVLLVLIVLSAFDIVKNNYKKLFGSVVFKLLFVVLLFFSSAHAHQKLDERYGGMNNYFGMEAIYELEPYLSSIGVVPQDTIISIPDFSHVSLYLMNRKGWTEYTDMSYNRGERIRYNQDSTGIAASIEKGAKYMVVNGIKELYFKPYLQPFCTHLAGKYKQVLIFDLKNYERNFMLPEREVIETLKCDAEKLDESKTSYLGEGGKIFRNGDTQDDENVFSGEYSVKLNEQKPYGMTIVLDSVFVDESFIITVWKKAEKGSSSTIIASSTVSGDFYTGDCEVVDTAQNGWEKLRMEFFITKDFSNHELAVYLYNPDKKAAWFDDLEIKRFSNNFNYLGSIE